MVLLQQMTKVPAAAKLWKKDISDAFHDPRFFGLQVDLVKNNWMDLLRQWVLADKERLSEILVRLPPPSAAGIMFGVGASAARLEADRKAQLNLRRIAPLVLSANDDYFVGELPALLQKLEDLLLPALHRLHLPLERRFSCSSVLLHSRLRPPPWRRSGL